MQEEWINTLYGKLQTKLSAEADRVKSNIPFIPVMGHYRDLMMPGGLHWWCNGFWPGILWQLSHASGEKPYRTYAQEVDERLVPLLEEPEKLDHDVGFLFVLSSLAEFLETGSELARDRVIKAADILLGRFHEKGGFIEAWNPGTIPGTDTNGMMIADCMMNLSLLYQASRITRNRQYAQAASRHADTALRCLVRPDGSAAHIARVDKESGELLEIPDGQGYAPGSAWSRGQGWILYGFTNAWKHTGRKEYLDAARRSAHYCISALAVRDWLPVVDFRAPQDGRYDSTAGMLIASALLELANAVAESEKPGEYGSRNQEDANGPENAVKKTDELGDYEAELYREAALRLLQACDEKFDNWDPQTDGIVTGGSLRYHDDRMAGASIIYGDYFLTEAVLKLKGSCLPVW